MAAGIVGTIGWLINYYLSQYGNDVVALFAAATAVALSSEIFARIRLQPVPVFFSSWDHPFGARRAGISDYA